MHELAHITFPRAGVRYGYELSLVPRLSCPQAQGCAACRAHAQGQGGRVGLGTRDRRRSRRTRKAWVGLRTMLACYWVDSTVKPVY